MMNSTIYDLSLFLHEFKLGDNASETGVNINRAWIDGFTSDGDTSSGGGLTEPTPRYEGVSRLRGAQYWKPPKDETRSLK